MSITHIEHIGIAVRSLEKSIEFYEQILGLKCYAVKYNDNQKVKVAFFKVGDTKIELLESTDSTSPVGKFIDKRGEGIHHIAFAVNDIFSFLSCLEEKGVQAIDKIPQKGAEGLNVSFLHPKATGGVLVEICE